MNMSIPKISALLTAVAFALGIALFFYLNNAFGGPTPISGLLGDDDYELEMTFDKAEGLLTKSLVLVRGVQVGEVRSVKLVNEDADVVIAIDSRYAPLAEGTKAQLRNRTVFGEKYVDLEMPPGRPPPAEDGQALPSGSEIASESTIELDDALEVLNDNRRKKLTKLLEELAVASRVPGSAARLNDTLASLADFTASVRDLTGELKGQGPEIAGLIEGGRVAVTTLGDREQALRELTSSARTTLEAIGEQADAVDRSLVQLPPTLAVTRSAIAGARGLALDARPVVQDLRRAIPDVRASVDDLGPVARDADVLVDRLPALRRAGDPVLRQAVPALRALAPVAEGLEPALANAVPVGRYAGKRKRELAANVANAAATTSGDSAGAWTRFFVVTQPGLAVGQRPADPCKPGYEPAAAGFCANAYPKPGYVRDSEPFSGRYPRLMPFKPPPPPSR